MKHLKKRWRLRLTLVFVVSVLVSALLVLLEMTDWAVQINKVGYSHGDGEGKNPPAVLMYILPFIKEIILIGVPMTLSLLIMKLFKRRG